MKTILKTLGAVVLLTFILVSCSKDDDPVDNDFFIGTYRGNISYNNTSGDDDVAAGNGSVTVTKIGSGRKYNFAFSNGIPDLNGIEFESKGDNILVNIGGVEGTNYIRIDASNLDILYIKDGKTWTADCTR